MVAKSQLLKKLRSSHQLCSEPMSFLTFGNWSLIHTVSQLTKKPIQLLFHMWPSLSSSEWCSVIWAMALFFAWAPFIWSWKETTKVLAWWDIYSCWWECLPSIADWFTTSSLLYQLTFSNLAIKWIGKTQTTEKLLQMIWIEFNTKFQEWYGIHLNQNLDMVPQIILIMEFVLLVRTQSIQQQF